MRKFVLLFSMILFAGFQLSAQNLRVSGTVTGPDGLPVGGATITVVGTTNVVVAESTGRYAINAPSDGILEFAFLGMETQQINISGRSVIDVMMSADAQSIEDVVVIAFGESTREAFTGSVKVVGSQELSKTQSSNVQDALVGKIAGVQFAAPSGRLGAGQNIYVRGVGSFSADVSKAPLWVVDGVPYDGDINNINTNDIESISVLKDSASNSLYGARGANGVIMVTTKRAKVGSEAVIYFDAKWGVNTRALQTYDVTKNAGEFYEMHHKSLYDYFRLAMGQSTDQAYISANSRLLTNNEGGLGYNVFTFPEGQNLIGRNGRLNPNATEGRLVTYRDQDYWLQPDNWLDGVYKKATMRQEYNFSVSGATDRSNFYASLGYLDNTGIIDGSNMNRFTARLRSEYQAKKWFKIGGNMAYTHFVWNNGNDSGDEGQSDGGNVFATTVQMAPIYPIFIRDGQGKIMTDEWGFNIYDSGDGRNAGAVRAGGGSSSPLQEIQLNKYANEGNAIMASGFADFNLYDGLKLTVNGSVNLDETRSTTLYNPYYGQFTSNGGIIYKGHSRDIAVNYQQLLSYNKTFGGLHNVNVLLGHEYYNRKRYALSAAKEMMWSPNNLELSSAVTDSQSASSSLGEYNVEGYFLRGQYDYDNRIFFSGSYRRDASSRFHPDHRWGNFWTASAAWIISRESWFPATTWLDMLKVRTSYGEQGRDGIPDYLYVDMYNISNDGSGGATSLFSRKGNPDITWETQGSFNVGVEFAVLNNRISGNIDYFINKNTDMLFSLSVPLEAGYSSIMTNIGDMANRGIEIELNAILMQTRDFQWDFSINMSHLKNKMTRLPDQYRTTWSDDRSMFGREDGSRFLAEGSPMYSFYIPTYAGPDPNTGKSLWYYYELKEGGDETKREDYERKTTDNYSTASDRGREFHGAPYPDLFGGFNTSLSWRGLDFSAGFTYQLGGKVIDSGYQTYMKPQGGTQTWQNYHRDLKNAWTPENPTSNIPRFALNDTYTNGTSDRFLISASYLNIQNLTLGYTLPRSFTSKFLVNSLRFYATCDNVWYWSKRRGLDPRQGVNGGTSPFYYAPIRTFSGGITITL